MSVVKGLVAVMVLAVAVPVVRAVTWWDQAVWRYRQVEEEVRDDAG